jgi:spermidine synthase
VHNGERVLVARHSAFQAILLTENESGLRSLRFGEGEARQSVVKVGDPSHLELPYARVLPACLAFARSPLRLLVVGLGGGTLPRFFHRHFPEMTIDVVELDRGVVEVAKEFCGLQEDSRLHVHVADGRDFVESSRGGYDLIILDCFDVDSIPLHLTTLEFLRSVRKALSADGIAVANVWGRASNPRYAHMLLTYRAAFEDLYIFDVRAPGTKIFVALTWQQQMTRVEVIRLTREIAKARGFTFKLSDEIAGFRHARSEGIAGGAVLMD